MEKEANHLERQHVHDVYEKIAPYFNDKRYKAWPRVQEFLLAQEAGSLVADVGCGNGKYLHINSQTFNIGCDYCTPLAEAARNRGYEVMVCDGLQLPYRDGCFDAVVSIAVIHHFSTKQRRVQAIREMARILRAGGQMMIYVWAMEQKRRKFEKQDLLIPWNMEQTQQNPLEKRNDMMEPVIQNLQSIDPLMKVHRTVPTKNTTKRPLSIDGMTGPGKSRLHPSKFLTQSLDSGLDKNSKCVSSDHTHGSILNKMFEYCMELTNLANRYPSRLSRSAHVLKQISDFLPKYMQSMENNTDSVSELLSLPLAKRCYQTNEGHEREILKDLSKAPLPDLKSNHKGPCDATPSFTSTGDYDNGAQHQQISPNKNSGCLRYYHIFKQGELDDLIKQCIPELCVVRTFYDHSNWCVVAEKKNQLISF
ncbi:probable tRNA methyltransferase 9B [Hyperolius riggenbachi]|uniref:probable tRNA methyltransferase 9B n=1 Tax=Hyperolius riggenbachi TaxID=752182 RepID=UPI0035A31168